MPCPHAFTAEALVLNARALPASRQRVALAFNLAGLDDGVHDALGRHPGVELEPRSGGELTLQARLQVLRELADQHPDLAPLLEAWINAQRPPAPPRLMGVLNVTPDSFSDGGAYFDLDRALDHGRRMVQDGAHLIDVGGESTRPGATPVEAQEELRRVLPVVQALAADGINVSIDTTKASVAEAALGAGATMINDVSGACADPRMLPLAAEQGCDLVLMHAQGDPGSMQARPHYDDPVAEVARFLRGRAAAAIECGVDPDRLLLDPGIGFGKGLEHNIALLGSLGELRSLGRPLLLGVSRKSFIGHLTGAEQEQAWRTAQRSDRPQDRLGGTAAAVALCTLAGAEVLRVHDVAIMAEAVRVAQAVRDVRVDGGPGDA